MADSDEEVVVAEVAEVSSVASDVVLGKQSEDAVSRAINHHLNVKGYCVVGLGLDEDLIEQAAQDAEQIEMNGHLYEPSSMFLDGLLGGTGSARICELELAGSKVPGVPAGKAIAELDALMTSTVSTAYPHFDFALTGRTAAILHQSGQSEGKNEVDDEEAAKWLAIFARHKLMVITFLGPRQGILELYPFDEPDSLPTQILGKPGSMVVLRPDLLAHSFSSSRDEQFCLSCFYIQDIHTSRHIEDAELLLTPCAAALDDWAMNRVKEVKENYEEGDAVRPKLPRFWEQMGTHSGFVGQHMFLRSISLTTPVNKNPDCFASACTANVDCVNQLPMMRFDVEKIYTAESEWGFYNQTNCRHLGYIEGADLFDNKQFRISPAESAGMDPLHRHILEGTYDCLYQAGYRAKDLNKAKGATFIAGNGMSTEWLTAEKTATLSGVCGAGNSVACGRVNFTFGLQGPCTSLDCGTAGSLLALSQACTIMTHRGKFEIPPFALVSVPNLVISMTRFTMFSASGMTSSVGRCLAFTDQADGFVRSEGLASCLVKNMVQMVDGEPILNEAEIDLNFGAMAGSAVNQNGKRSSMMSPDGAAEQDLMASATRQASISPLDVDCVDTNAWGSILQDAVECASTARAYRPDGIIGLEDANPLVIQATNSSYGNGIDCSGLIKVIKIMLSHKLGSMMPTLHLGVISPHIDLGSYEPCAVVSNELLERRLPNAYSGVTSKSFTGTNVHMLAYGQVDRHRCRTIPAPKQERPTIKYWPEGGGELDLNRQPRNAYYIAGSWSRFQDHIMENEGNGVYGFTVTLGENRWEHFQIWLDGQKERALHPGDLRGGKNSEVCGPENTVLFNTWLLDGRPVSMYKSTTTALTYSTVEPDPIEVDTQDTGRVGDQYRVRLRVSGKFRTVEWEKLDDKTAIADVPKGKYYVIGAWTNMAFQEMSCEDEKKGLYSLDVSLSEDADDFLIVRDQDWMQVFHPTRSGLEEAAGPDPMQMCGDSWRLGGSPGDRFKITLQRKLDDTGKGTQQVSWKRTGQETKSIQAFKPQPFHMVGTWDEWGEAMKMNWTGDNYEFFVELGASQTMSFTIQSDARGRRCFHPSVAGAGLTDGHKIQGSQGNKVDTDMCWTIRATQGKRYRITLEVADEVPQKVEWQEVAGSETPGTRVEDAICRGFFASCW